MDRCLVLGVASLVGLVASYVIGVRTVRGQFLDLLAMSGQKIQTRTLVRNAQTLLGTISIASVLLMLVAVTVVGVVRKRPVAGFIVGAIVVGSVVTTEVLKLVLLTRPLLVRTTASDPTVNTLPSGHSTIAMCVAVALVLLAPKHHQMYGAIVGTPYAIGIGVATVVAHWHRPSDVVAAWFVVATFTFFGLIAMRLTGALHPDESASWSPLVGPGLAVLILASTVALAITTLLGLTARLSQIPVGQQRTALRSAFVFGFSVASIAAIGATFIGALLWVLSDSKVEA